MYCHIYFVVNKLIFTNKTRLCFTLTHISLASFFCGTYENSADPDQTPHSALSDEGPHCLHTECSIEI